MTDKEKIREFLIGMADSACCDYATERDIRNIILSYIDSLKEDPKHSSPERNGKDRKEEPVSEELEEEIKQYFKDTIISENPQREILVDWGSSIARHFAEWQKQKDLKWLADNHKQIFNNGWAEGYGSGRDSMEEDMMKDAVEGTVCKSISNELCVKSEPIPNNHLSGVKFGDKVKLIILPSE